MNKKLSAQVVLQRYIAEDLPEFVGISLNDVNQKGGFGNAPLNIAATRGDVEEVEALLDGGADINVRGEQQCTPLHDAVGQGHAAVVQLLLRRGASTSLRDDSGFSAKDVAIRRGHKAIAALFDEAEKRR
ncbi:MAG: ankyrin repeat domain-containing protein [Elusimicrobiota bacterium]